jgi:hypothetical protein
MLAHQSIDQELARLIDARRRQPRRLLRRE